MLAQLHCTQETKEPPDQMRRKASGQEGVLRQWVQLTKLWWQQDCAGNQVLCERGVLGSRSSLCMDGLQMIHALGSQMLYRSADVS